MARKLGTAGAPPRCGLMLTGVGPARRAPWSAPTNRMRHEALYRISITKAIVKSNVSMTDISTETAVLLTEVSSRRPTSTANILARLSAAA